MGEGPVKRRAPGRPKGPTKKRVVAMVLPATDRALRFHAFVASKSLGEYLDGVVEGRGLQGRISDPVDTTTGL